MQDLPKLRPYLEFDFYILPLCRAPTKDLKITISLPYQGFVKIDVTFDFGINFDVCYALNSTHNGFQYHSSSCFFF